MSPALRQRFGSLLDSLLTITSPDSIIERALPQTRSGVRRVGNYDPRSRTIVVTPEANRRHLVHEFGHALSDLTPALFWNFIGPIRAKSVLTPEEESQDAEQFADSFADIFTALSRGDARTVTQSSTPGTTDIIHWLLTRPPFKKE